MARIFQTCRSKYDTQQQALTDRIVQARVLLKQQEVPYDFRVKISQICSDLNVDGIRGDIVTNRAAKVLLGLSGIGVAGIGVVVP